METIILSAGLSSRMGQNKALLEINGKKIINILLEKLLPLSSKIIIVLGSNLQEVETFLRSEDKLDPKIDLVYNKDHLEGMFSSVQCGFRNTSGSENILLQMIDQPFVSPEIYSQLLKIIDKEHLIFQPASKQKNKLKPGHPILFLNSFKEKVINADKSSNLRNVIKAQNSFRKFYLTEDRSIFMNLNTPEDVIKLASRE